MFDQAEKLRQLARKMQSQTNGQQSSAVIKQESKKARVITVTSGKGGVGKTNFTVNLALALAGKGQRVLIIDADLGMANVDVVLGCSAPYNILNLLEERYSLSDIIAEGPRGIRFMSGGSGIYHLANLTEAQLQMVINQIMQCDTMADIILIDTGAGLNRNVLNFVMAADEVIVITTPEPTAITDAYAMIKAYSAHKGTAPLQLVVNRVSEDAEGQLVVDKMINVAMRFLGLPITSLGFVFEDRNMVKAVKSQSPLLISYPDTASARCIEKIAHRILFGENLPEPKGIKGFFTKLISMMR